MVSRSGRTGNDRCWKFSTIGNTSIQKVIITDARGNVSNSNHQAALETMTVYLALQQVLRLEEPFLQHLGS